MDRGGGIIPPWFMNSVVLWYDIGRQGATNESMAENPTLKDLSGNGNDATCYNFGWSGMSGIGGYPDRTDMTRYWALYRSENGFRTKTSIHITSIKAQTPELINNNYILYWFPFGFNPLTGEYTNDEITLKIYNPNHIELKYRWLGDIASETHFNSDLTLTLPSREWNVNNKQIAFGIFQTDASADVEDANITIELLPQYPNALVSDGVDDYAAISGLPIQNWNVGYTIIAKRKTLDIVGSSCLFSKRLSGVGADDASGAFQVERIYGSDTTNKLCFSYGGRTKFEQFEPSDFIYQTSKSYCGHPLTVSSAPDSDTLSIFKWTAQSSGVPSGKYALYSLMLFNRDLTNEEIQWVKNNLMQ